MNWVHHDPVNNSKRITDTNGAVTFVASVNVPGQAETPTKVQISGTARYVKVQLVGTNFLCLAEVKVGPASGVSAFL